MLSVPVFARTTPRAGPVCHAAGERAVTAGDRQRRRSGPAIAGVRDGRGEQPGQQAGGRAIAAREPGAVDDARAAQRQAEIAQRLPGPLGAVSRRAATVRARAHGLEQHLGREVVGFLAHRPQHRVDARRRVERRSGGARRRPAGADGAVDLHAGLPHARSSAAAARRGRATRDVLRAQRQRHRGGHSSPRNPAFQPGASRRASQSVSSPTMPPVTRRTPDAFTAGRGA